MAIPSCCLTGFEWEGKPTGRIGKLARNNAYIAGDNPDVAVLLVHDLIGWTFSNTRLLADHYAREANATVYLPDFFGGEVLPAEPLLRGEFHKVDIAGYMKRNSREIREPEIFECAKTLRAEYKKIGAVGYCFGGWAVFRLGAKEHLLVDCITTGHPSLLTKKDIDEVAVPVQILAPEIDPIFSAEMKTYSFETIQKLGIPFAYQHYPGVEHACFIRGNPDLEGEREAMVKGKNAAVYWFKQFLHDL